MSEVGNLESFEYQNQFKTSEDWEKKVEVEEHVWIQIRPMDPYCCPCTEIVELTLDTELENN